MILLASSILFYLYIRGFALKKVEEYKEKIKDIPDENIVYVDETGIDSFYYREFGYAKRGTKVYQKIPGRKFQRTNIVAAMCGNSIISGPVLEEMTVKFSDINKQAK